MVGWFWRQVYLLASGFKSFSYLLYKGLMLNHVERDIKEYLKSKECRRKTLLKYFGSENFTLSGPLHTCCDKCAQSCKCGTVECSSYTLLRVTDTKDLEFSCQLKRNVSNTQKTSHKYHKSLVIQLIRKSAKGHVKSLTNLNALLGFSDTN